MHSFGVPALATLYFALQVGAQIPMPCEEHYDPSNLGKCCPNVTIAGQWMGECGSLEGRGKCVSVDELCNTAYDENYVEDNQDNACRNIIDARLNWPRKLFTHVCKCEGKYGDYNCGGCAYGYIENSESGCVLDFRPRRSITSLSNEEWEEYLKLLNLSKHTDSSRYVVMTGNQETGEQVTSKITTYNLFIWLHHYATKDHIYNYGAEDSGKKKLY